MALKKPKPRVKVITWSKQMRLKRPFEVQLVTGREEFDDELETDFPIQRYAKIEDANAHAEVLKKALAWKPPA